MTETELMLTAIKNCPRVDLYVDPKALDSFQAKQLKEFRQRRENHEPLQYILGSCEFMDCKLLVDPRVLIPRPETEVLVETIQSLSFPNALVGNPKEARTGPPTKTFGGDNNHPLSILDLGTGSGNIAIVLAKHIEECRVTAVDFSKGCLDLATLNAKMNSVQERIQFIQSDLFEGLRFFQPPAQFDIIVSNPPYIPTDELDSLPPEVRYEPRAALDGGKEGLDFYRRIFAECRVFLKPNGWLILEIGSLQANDLKKMLRLFAHLKLREIRKDLCGRDRVLVVQRNS